MAAQQCFVWQGFPRILILLHYQALQNMLYWEVNLSGFGLMATKLF